MSPSRRNIVSSQGIPVDLGAFDHQRNSKFPIPRAWIPETNLEIEWCWNTSYAGWNPFSCFGVSKSGYGRTGLTGLKGPGNHFIQDKATSVHSRAEVQGTGGDLSCTSWPVSYPTTRNCIYLDVSYSFQTSVILRGSFRHSSVSETGRCWDDCVRLVF